MSDNIQQSREWRASRRLLWSNASTIVLLAGYLTFLTLWIFHPEWDQKANGHEEPFPLFLLLISFGFFGSFLLLLCRTFWVSLHGWLRIDGGGIEFQEGWRVTTVSLADVEKVSWRRIWPSATLTVRGKPTNVNFGGYAPKDRGEMATALHAALAGCEQMGWEAFAVTLPPRVRTPVSLPKSANKLLKVTGITLAMSVLVAIGLLLRPNFFDLRLLCWMSVFLCAMAGASFALLAAWELIRYQRTWKIFASLILALAICGVTGWTMAYAVNSQIIQLKMHLR